MLCVGATTPIMKSEKVELLEAWLRMQKRRFPFDVLEWKPSRQMGVGNPERTGEQ